MRENTKAKFSVADLVFTALFAALTAVCAVIAVPMPMTAVPVSLLVLGVFLTGGLLEKKKAFFAEMVYLLIGAVGVPVFAGFSSGVGVLFGPTGGYLLASPIMAFVIAWIAQPFRNSRRTVLTGMLAVGMISALLMCYLLGTAWFCIYKKMTVLQGLGYCIFPFVLPDVIKLVVAVSVTAVLQPVLYKTRALA